MTSAHALPQPRGARRARWQWAAAVWLLVLAGHAWLLPAMAPQSPPRTQAQPVGAMQVRQIRVVAETPPALSPAVLPAAPKRVAAPRPAADVPPAALPAALMPVVARLPASAAPASAAAAQPADGADVPLYATRLPPPSKLTYELRRGAVGGRGVLDWQPRDARYELRLEGRALGFPLIEQTSRGAFDAAGIAPERFVDKRRGRDAQAANFQRGRGIVTFSGPDMQVPLSRGIQDRLSWMLQLPAIVAADPARFEPGATITLFVVGARGDAGVWRFTVEAREPLQLPAGPVAAALHLQRVPRRPYDTQVDVWLDPARHHLPVKIRLAVPENGDATEFSLQAIDTTP